MNQAVLEKDPALEALHKGGELGSECKISSHLLLAALDQGRAGLEILHQDLFDSSAPVVLSALAVLGRMGDPRSPKLIVRLLASADEAIQAAAAQALGASGGPGSARVLADLLKITKSEKVRCATLEALALQAPEDPAVQAMIRDIAQSQLVSPESRACAASLQVRREGASAAAQLLETNKGELVEAVYSAAGGLDAPTQVALQHAAVHYHRLSPACRRLAVGLAGASGRQEARTLLLAGLQDVDPEVRRAAYQVLGTHPVQTEHYPEILAAFSERVDPVLTLEEEALAALERMEASAAGLPFPQLGQKLLLLAQELFKALCTREREMSSDVHELGWLITRSRDYLEYYADEDFRQALLNFLKGGAYYTPDRLLAMLKATAVKVEVRHFDGYKALAEIIQNPKRPGIALVARELAIARLGRRETLYRLIRILRLCRLAPVPAGAPALFSQLYAWARESRIFRLAEAAMQAQIRVDPLKATEACEESLHPPVFSKLCAIAAIRLLKDLDWQRLQPALLALLAGCDDSYILLNLMDALSSYKLPLGGELVKALISLLRGGRDQEVLGRVAELLGSQNEVNILDRVTEGFQRAEPWRQGLILGVVERALSEGRVANREGLSEFLYRALRSGGEGLAPRAAVLLWRLGDDYALEVLREQLAHGDNELRIRIVQALEGAVSAALVPALQPLLRLENAGLQEALRATLAGAPEQARGRILNAVLSARGAGSGSEEAPAEVETELRLEMQHEKKSFRFEREHVQELAILFTDIQGYSRKAQSLSSMQLASLLQEYEGILLPTVAAHNGELIKKMGDGHMFVFQSPLDGTLATIRLQKALKRFNGYREEALRLVVRAGLHWGKVVCKEGDVLGNHVNIASRLESSARGGSILISDAVFQLLRGQVHAREIGLIEVKNIAQPIRVFEPYEVVLDLPAELDPLKRAKVRAAGPESAAPAPPGGAQGSNGKGSQVVILERGAVEFLAQTFATLARLCQKAERQQVPVLAIRQELTGRWQKLRGMLERSHKE